MRIRILSSDPNSTTAFYRTVGPLKLYPEGNDVSLFLPGQQISWSDLVGVDILFMDRPDTHAHYSALKLAQSVGCKVIVDWDINPFAMSEEDHPLYWKYTESAYCQVIKEILIACDGLIVENDAIAKAFEVFNENLFVRRNQYFQKLLKPMEKIERDGRLILVPSIYFLLSDLDEHRDHLTEVISSAPEETRWVFTIPPHYKRDMRVFAQYESVSFVDQVYDPVQWMRYVTRLQPDIVLAPMKMNRFNASRYNNVSLDAFYAGGVAVCPDYLPYRYSNTAQYSTSDIMKQLVYEILTGSYQPRIKPYTPLDVGQYSSSILFDIFEKVVYGK